MSEHTAEYVLVPALERILRQVYAAVFPFWFWSSREGSSVADLPGHVKLLAVFARRPKVFSPRDREITVKFHERISRIARRAVNSGIPVLAGLPLVSELCELASSPKCAWFVLGQHSEDGDDIVHRIDIVEGRLLTAPRQGIEGPVSSERLLDYVGAFSQPHAWTDAISIFKELRRTDEDRYGSFPFGANNYSPFFFALIEEEISPTSRPKSVAIGYGGV
jgi:hypothetical protein